MDMLCIMAFDEDSSSGIQRINGVQLYLIEVLLNSGCILSNITYIILLIHLGIDSIS